MADDPAAPTPQPDPQPDPKTFNQEQVNALLAEQKRTIGGKYADYADLKAKAERLDAIEEQNKTDLQKEQERATAAEERAKAAETKALRAEVAQAKNVPSSHITGDTREQLEASADALLAWRGEQKQTGPSGLTPGQEKRRTAGEDGRAEAARRFAKAAQQ
jgi:membrane protease subunit (stomatin/prohibitin family)